ncbi:MAG: NfeD family protein [Acidimicrobiia bacterium]
MLITVLVAAPPAAGQAGQAGQPEAPVAPLDVIEVKGRIDTIEADFITRSVAQAERSGSQLLVIQLDSPGAVISDAEMGELSSTIRDADLPVAVWVGTSKARAFGGAVRLLRAAEFSGMANGTSIGRFDGPCPECRPDDPLVGGDRLSSSEAERQGAVDVVTPTLGDFIVELDGVQLKGRSLKTAQIVERDGQPRREPAAQVRFAKLNLVERVLHSTTSPSVAYLLLTLGLLLMVFEFYSVGIGIAGLTGAGSMILSAYGLGALDATPLGLALVALAAFGYAVDVQAGAPRAWTVIATVSLLVGSIVLFPGDRRVPWVTVVLVLIGAVLFMVRGMASMVRARFSTATIGRESMIGEPAEATTAIGPEGTVRVRGALWRARVNRATPIAAGQAVRVVAIDGLVLEVEPSDEAAAEGSDDGG